MHPFIPIVLVLALTAPLAQAQQVPQAPRTITVPSQLYPNIQAAVNAIAAGGTVKIRPGLYAEHVVIAGKSVKLAGVLGQQARATIQAPDGESAVVTYGFGGQGTLQDLELVGGSAGVEALSAINQQGPAPAVVLRQVDVRDGGHGVLGYFDSLDMANSKVQGVRHHGVVVIQPRVLKIQRSLFRTGGGVGIYIVNDAPPVGDIAWVVTRAAVAGFAGGGLHVIGRGAPLLVSWFNANDNGTAGITLDGTPAARVSNSHISGSYPDAAGFWGDGIRIAGASVDLIDVGIDSPARAGVAIFGCAESGQHAFASLKDITMKEPGQDINMEVYPGCGSTLADSVRFDEYMTGTVSTVLCLHDATPTETGCHAQTGGTPAPVGMPITP